MNENRGYTQRYAMIFGTYMGIFWVLKFILVPLGLKIPFLFMLFIGLTICVPFMSYHYTRLFRNQVCGGSIGFGQAWIFSWMTYMFAALFTAVGHYIYFNFIDNGFILNTLQAQLDLVSQSGLPGLEPYLTTYQETLDMLALKNPLEITMQQLSSNVMWGGFLAIPTALFVMRRRAQAPQ